MAAHANINGLWTGSYTYAHQGPDAVAFTAWFDDLDGEISGSTLEPNTFAPLGPEDLAADILGSRVGQALMFSKTYTPGTGVVQPPVRYSGAISTDFTLIQGEWYFDAYNDYKGGFELRRSSGALADRLARRAISIGHDT